MRGINRLTPEQSKDTAIEYLRSVAGAVRKQVPEGLSARDAADLDRCFDMCATIINETEKRICDREVTK
jgi:hypothetical protein